MENLEEDLQNIITTTTPELEVEVMASTIEAQPLTVLQDGLDDSVQIIENPIEVLDLTSPQASGSSPLISTNSAGAVGVSSSLVKRNLEEALKDTNADSFNSSPLDQNPSTSSSAANTSGTSGGNVLECPICLQTCIHPARLPCGHIFCFLCVKGVAYKNRRCAMCRREIPPEFLDHPQLVNGIEDICTTKATDDGYQWFYEGRNGGWWAYEKRNAAEIEQAFNDMFNKRLNAKDKKKKEVKKEEKDTNDEEDDDEDDTDCNIEVEVDEHDFDDSEDDEELEEELEGLDSGQNVENLTFDIQICGNMYTIDFQNMVQYPQNMPYRKRKICRAKGLPAKGVAGLLTHNRRRNRTRVKREPEVVVTQPSFEDRTETITISFIGRNRRMRPY